MDSSRAPNLEDEKVEHGSGPVKNRPNPLLSDWRISLTALFVLWAVIYMVGL
jgi:hypothetical protein